MSACAAQHGGRSEFFLWPNGHGVPGKFGVAFMTGKPIAAAFELDRDDIAFAAVMNAPRLLIDVYADNIDAVNYSHVERSRGQSSTRIDAMTRQTAMKTNPESNEPVR